MRRLIPVLLCAWFVGASATEAQKPATKPPKTAPTLLCSADLAQNMSKACNKIADQIEHSPNITATISAMTEAQLYGFDALHELGVLKGQEQFAARVDSAEKAFDPCHMTKAKVTSTIELLSDVQKWETGSKPKPEQPSNSANDAKGSKTSKDSKSSKSSKSSQSAQQATSQIPWEQVVDNMHELAMKTKDAAEEMLKGNAPTACDSWTVTIEQEGKLDWPSEMGAFSFSSTWTGDFRVTDKDIVLAVGPGKGTWDASDLPCDFGRSWSGSSGTLSTRVSGERQDGKFRLRKTEKLVMTSPDPKSCPSNKAALARFQKMAMPDLGALVIAAKDGAKATVKHGKLILYISLSKHKALTQLALAPAYPATTPSKSTAVR